MHLPRLLILFTLLTSCWEKQQERPTKSLNEFSEREKALYVLGYQYARHLEEFRPSKSELSAFSQGVEHKLGQKIELDDEEISEGIKVFTRIGQTMVKKNIAQAHQAFQSFIQKLRQDSRYIFDPSGIIYRTLEKGKVALPKTYSYVTIDFVGQKINGKIFDSSEQPTQFPADAIIECWKLAIKRMKLKQRIELICPAKLAFGAEGIPPIIEAGEAVIFDFTLKSASNSQIKAGN